MRCRCRALEHLGGANRPYSDTADASSSVALPVLRFLGERPVVTEVAVRFRRAA